VSDAAPAAGASPGVAGGPFDDPVFREPWEAQAFAMTVLLHRRGVFSWAEWAQALSAQIARAGTTNTRVLANHADFARPTEHGVTTRETPYYQHWLAALESLVAGKGASSADELSRYQRAWEHAAHRTPHGQTIDLLSEDLGG
jgi:nitrile hydratase accessory protein